MADLSFLDQEGTVAAIDRAYRQADKPRGYLGLSQAGHECPRFLWYTHHGYVGQPAEGRVLRLFQLGNLVERQVIADLKKAGCKCYYSQREVKFSQDGLKLLGHIDGIVTGLTEAPKKSHLLEIKSANKKKFDELVKLSSYEKWNETYYWQVQFYMLGLSEQASMFKQVKRAVVIVYCKDDSRLYMERLCLDKEAAIERLQRVFEAISAREAPERACPRPDNYKAKFCDFWEQCWCATTQPNQGDTQWW